MITAVVTTADNESDMHHITDVADKSKLKQGARVKADKGYASAANRQALKERGFKDNIMHKATKNKALTVWQTKFNQIISKTRYKATKNYRQHETMVQGSNSKVYRIKQNTYTTLNGSYCL